MLMRIQFAAPCFANRSIKTTSVRLFHRCGSLASDGKKTILVTGATGMIGSHFVAKALAAESSWTIACLVRGENGDGASQRLAEKMKVWNRCIPEDEITHPRMIPSKVTSANHNWECQTATTTDGRPKWMRSFILQPIYESQKEMNPPV